MKIFLPMCLLSFALTSSAQEAFEVGPKDTDKLPGGKEADGIVGDFVMRNDAVEALISSDSRCVAPT